MNRWVTRLIPLAILALMTALRIFDPAPIERARWIVFDSYQQLKPRQHDPRVPVKIVDIDDESLARIGQWPWPRTLMAQLVERLAEMGAASIALDIVFAEPDRSSPENILESLQASPHIDALRELFSNMPSNDHVFSQSIAATPTVTGFVLTQDEGTRLPSQKGTFAFAGDDPRMFVPAFRGAVANLAQLEEMAHGNGALNVVPDHDEIIRRVPLVLSARETLVPALAIEAIRVALQSESYLVKSSGASGVLSFGQHTGVRGVRVGPVFVPTGPDGRMLMHFALPSRERYIPAWRILDGDVAPEEILGHIVFVGTSAAGLHDLRSTPVAAGIAGVEIHAQAVEQILTGAFLERPDIADGLEVIYVVVLGLILIFLLSRIGAVWTLLVGGGAIAGAVGGSWFSYAELGWMVDPVSPSLMVLVVFLSATLMSYLRTDIEKRQIRSAFGHYVAPAVVEQLASDPSRLRLGGEVRTITVMFSDIRRFTSISEQFKNDPEGLTSLINRFLTPMTEVVLAHRGTIDKYIGDCLMCFWNAPLDDETHAANACHAALVQQDALTNLNEQLAAETPGDSGAGSDLKADYTMAKRYSVGLGVAQDQAKAIEMFRRQAALGYANAQYSLAKACRDGAGTEPDLAEALRWFTAAARQGYAKAQYQLGLRYLEGEESESDPSAALTWLTLAARTGLNEAEHSRQGLLHSLSAENVALAEREARAWTPEAPTQRAIHLEMGTGIATGACLVGNLGSVQRFDYSALGDPVNLASRLEGQTKNYGIPIIIAEATRLLVPEFAALELDIVAVAGKREPVRIFGLMGGPDLSETDRFRQLDGCCQEMLTAYRQQRWADAKALLIELERNDYAASMEDLCHLYLNRIDAMQQNPPGPEWDGTFVATKK